MERKSELPNRRSIRLREYDYSQAGAYFVTICLQDKLHLFGEVVGDEMQPNDAGRMIDSWWNKLAEKYAGLDVSTYVVMPNHFHGIVVIRSDGGRPRGAAPTLGGAIDWFKSMTTNAYIRGVREQGWMRFNTRLWQRNYYEHIIRTEEDLGAISEYIALNPANWANDRENRAALQTTASKVVWQV